MDDKHTKQMLDQLADLYLTGTNAVPVKVADPKTQLDAPEPIKMSPKVAVARSEAGYDDQETVNVGEGLTLVGQRDDPYRLKFNDESELDKVSGVERVMASRRVEMVVAGNLPGYADGWISQYASHVAQSRGLVLMLHVDDQHIDLDVFGPVGYDLTGLNDLHAESGGPLGEVLERVLNDRQHWIECVLIHNACGEAGRREEVRDGAHRCVLLSGCDTPAQMAGVRLMRNLYGENAVGELEVVLMGKMAGGPDEVLDLINEELREGVGAVAELGACLQQMQPVNRTLLASFDNEPSQWPLVRDIVAGVEDVESRAQAIDFSEDTVGEAVGHGFDAEFRAEEGGILFDEAERIVERSRAAKAGGLRDFGASVSALDDMLSQKVLLDSELMAMAHSNRVDRSDGGQLLNMRNGKIIADKQLEPTVVADGLKKGLAELERGLVEDDGISGLRTEPIERVVEQKFEPAKVKAERIAESEGRIPVAVETAEVDELGLLSEIADAEFEAAVAAEKVMTAKAEPSVSAEKILDEKQIDELAEAVRRKLEGGVKVDAKSSDVHTLCLTKMLDQSMTLMGRGMLLEARCPDFEHVELCLDEVGGLHLLCHQDEIDSVDVVMVQLMEVKCWVEKHWSLLSMTQRQLRFDKEVEPCLHVFTDQGIAGTQLIGRMGDSLRLHLLQEVKIGAERTWVCNDLN